MSSLFTRIKSKPGSWTSYGSGVINVSVYQLRIAQFGSTIMVGVFQFTRKPSRKPCVENPQVVVAAGAAAAHCWDAQ